MISLNSNIDLFNTQSRHVMTLTKRCDISLLVKLHL